MVGSVTTTCIRPDGVVTKVRNAVPAARPVPTSVTHTGLGVASIARRGDAAAALRNVVAGTATTGPLAAPQAGTPTVVRPIIGRRRVVRPAMVPSATPRRRPATAVLPSEAAPQPRQPASAPIYAVTRRRESTLRVPAVSDGAVVATPAITARLVVVDPIPTGIGDLPVSGLASATPVLGLAGGRATTAPGMEAASSGSLGNPIRAPSVGIVLFPLVGRVARSGVQAVLRD